MSSLPADLHQRIDTLVHSHPVLLFMKGDRTAPRCGFSARVVGVLDGLLPDYSTVDILSDEALRSGMKVYGDWPTFPQLWVGGQLVGGCDIIEQLDASGELATTLGVTLEPINPTITVTEGAAKHLKEALGEEEPMVRLSVGGGFTYGLEPVETPGPRDEVAVSNGIKIVLDRASAVRGDGLTLDLFQTPQGLRMSVDNPNEPASVQQFAVTDYADWRGDNAHHLIDVRTPQEWAIAHIEGARLMDDETLAWLNELDRDTTLVFQCHHGSRSQRAAQHFLEQGFTSVFNLSGGIEAWSTEIDQSVPRY